MDRGPQRIVCLSAETVDTLYRLGCEDRIVGISGFTVHPPRARKEKPKVSAFTSARLEQVIALKPDLVLAFSDLQADLCMDLVRAGLQVHVFNQRSIAATLQSIATLGRLISEEAAALDLIDQIEQHLERVKAVGRQLPYRPRVYFEEWDEPMICGILWVSELIELAGGIDVFADRARKAGAADRILDSASEIVAAQPDVIIGSWCGKKFRPERVSERPGFQQIPAVRKQHLYEIKSADILQPGPTNLIKGSEALQLVLRRAAGKS